MKEQQSEISMDQDRIVSIEVLGREHVYDIEVEGTHNFMAGRYINKKTGKSLTATQETAYAAWKEGEGIIYGLDEFYRSAQPPNQSKRQLKRQLTFP